VKTSDNATVTVLTVKQTAERIGLAEYFVRKLCWENKIRYVKSGKKYLIPWELFLSYITGQAENDVPAIRDLNAS